MSVLANSLYLYLFLQRVSKEALSLKMYNQCTKKNLDVEVAGIVITFSNLARQNVYRLQVDDYVDYILLSDEFFSQVFILL